MFYKEISLPKKTLDMLLPHYQLTENFCVYLQAKNQIISHDFLKICKLLILGALDMPGYKNPK